MGLGLLILLGLGTFVVRWDIQRRTESEYALLTTQDIQLARVFTRAATAWLVRGDQSVVEDAADLLLDGSAQYVRIVVNQVTILDKQHTGYAAEPPDLTEMGDVGSEADPWHQLREGGLDVAIPIQFAGRDEPDNGIVQIGFSDAQVKSRLTQHRRLVLLTAGGGWFALVLIAALIHWLLAVRQRAEVANDREIEADGILRRGGLEIDTESCNVLWNGEGVDLTPKTYELLLFLAQHEGKTYSDADLLDELWADAPYAASNDVKQCIYLLRQRLGAVCEDPKRVIVNVKGFGYRLGTPDEGTLNEN